MSPIKFCGASGTTICSKVDIANEGAGRLQSSTLLKVLNAGDYAQVPSELLKWESGGGKKLPGLVTRREAEAALFVG